MNEEDQRDLEEITLAALSSIGADSGPARGSVHRVIRSLATYCYLLGHESGYAEGHSDGKSGKDQRQYDIRLNSSVIRDLI